MALGAVVGSAIGTATAWVLKFDKAEISAGIYGFNSALVGIATLFFFRPGAVSIGLLVVGCVAATLVTWLMRRYVPFPTYTTPFIVTTWALYFLGLALGVAQVEPGGPPAASGFVGGRGPRRRPGDVPGERLDGAACSSSGSPSATGGTRCGSSPASVLGMLVGIYHHDSADGSRGARALRLQRDTGGGRPVPLAAVADPAAAGHPALGAAHRVLPAARAAGPDGAVRAGDLAGPGARLARRQAVLDAGSVASVTEVAPGVTDVFRRYSNRPVESCPCICHRKNATSC